MISADLEQAQDHFVDRVSERRSPATQRRAQTTGPGVLTMARFAEVLHEVASCCSRAHRRGARPGSC
jgi:hypothetical protein